MAVLWGLDEVTAGSMPMSYGVSSAFAESKRYCKLLSHARSALHCFHNQCIFASRLPAFQDLAWWHAVAVLTTHACFKAFYFVLRLRASKAAKTDACTNFCCHLLAIVHEAMGIPMACSRTKEQATAALSLEHLYLGIFGAMSRYM